MREITVTAENFETEVLKSDKPVLLDFWAEWCGPCRMQSPILADFAEEHDDVKVGKVNVDQQMPLANRSRRSDQRSQSLLNSCIRRSSGNRGRWR